MIFNSAGTIYIKKLMSAMLVKKKYRPELNTTLNEKFNVYPNYDIQTEEYPSINVLTIGCGGLDIIDTTVTELKRSRHSTIDGALYEHIPFLIKPFGTILTAEERARFRLKSKVKKDGTYYDYYYGIVLDHIDYDDRIMKIKLVDGLSNMYPLITNEDPSILAPTSSTLKPLDELTEEFVLNVLTIKIQLTKKEVEDIVANYKFITGKDVVVNITELGICSSLETVVKDNVVPDLIEKENVWCQIGYHVDVNIDLQMSNDNSHTDGLEYIIDIGGMEAIGLPK